MSLSPYMKHISPVLLSFPLGGRAHIPAPPGFFLLWRWLRPWLGKCTTTITQLQRGAAHAACCVTVLLMVLTCGVLISRLRCSRKIRPSCPCFSGCDFLGAASRPAQGAGHPQTPALDHARRVCTALPTPATKKQRNCRHGVFAPRDVLALPASECTQVCGLTQEAEGGRHVGWAAAPGTDATDGDEHEGPTPDNRAVAAATWPSCGPQPARIAHIAN